MKRRVLSFIITLALCLNLCPVWVLAAGGETDGGLCPHHPAHTDLCGYAPPEPGQDCTHTHDDSCYTTETDCVHEHTSECYPDSGDGSGEAGPVLCAHVCSEDSGCVTRTLSCPHEHDDTCGYVPENPGAPCTFVCRICPIEALIAQLPASVSADNSERVQIQLSEIFDLYEELTADEQQLVDISPCVSLLDQIDGLGTEVQSDTPSDSPPTDGKWILSGPQGFEKPFEVSFPYLIDTNGYAITGLNSTAIRVTASGDLELKGTVVSQTGAGVEVSGSLSIPEQADIKGETYALDIASGATVSLSAGKYVGKSAAIHMESGSFASLLAPDCAYFDESGKQIQPADVGMARTVIVKQCTSHSNKYTSNAGSPTHSWTCEYCGTGAEEEKCTFEFNGNASASCSEQCGHSITITVDESALGDLIYNGADQTANVTLTVSLEDGTTLTEGENKDYIVNYSARTDVGDITVTVTGLTFNGTFVKTYHIDPDQPGIKWDAAAKELEYDGRRTTIKDELPNITITIKAPNNEDLHPYLQYSYKKTGDTEFTDGLPLDVGVYEIKAYLLKSQNYEAAETDPLLTLTIKAIDPVTAAPEAAKPTYNGSSRALVTAGTVDSRATGAEILFATSENGEYSTTIPTGTDAGDYEVWYKVEGTGNYNAVGPIKIDGVEILRKKITPVVTLSDYTYLYDGGFKEPKVTVKDEDNVTVLLDTEYAVTYADNQNVGTAKVTVTDKPGGNYDLEQVEKEFQITARAQETLSITQKPNSVTYGEQFTLSTTGGSGSGDVTWEITNGTDVAEIDQNSGQVTVVGHGSATVKATKSGADPAPVTRAADGANYEDATATWTFTAVKKPVTAIVTAEDKDYDGDKTATVHAVVEQGVLPKDVITIDDLPGEFIDENAGVDKIVSVDTSSPVISGTNFEHYDISFSTTTVKATIHKAIVDITTAPVAAAPTYDGNEHALIGTGAIVDTTGVDVEYALSEDGPYSTDFPKATNAGAYTVWYRVKETDNYIGQAPQSVPATISKKPVSPKITLTPDSFIFDGTAKEPAVTLTEADGTTEIPDTEYTVSYSNNTNVSTAAAVTVTAKDGGNYSFTPVTETFTITEEKAQIVTAPQPAGDPLVFSNRAQKLVTAGTGSGGTMVYRVGNTGDFEPAIPVQTNAGDYTVYYKVKGDGNHSDSDEGQVTVTIAPKTVKDPTIELLDDQGNALVSYIYDGTAKEPTVVVKDGSTLINAGGADEYNIIYSDNVDAGKATVNITDKPGGNYTVTGSATFVIQKADIVFTKDPADAGITYDGKAHELLIPGETDGGEVLYALNSKTSTYTAAIPTAANAGDYTVYYKVVGDKNHNDFAAQPVSVTIQRKPLAAITIELTPDSFVYDGTVKMPTVTVKDGGTVLPKEEYTQTYSDPAPKDQGTYTITITEAAGGNYDLTGVTANTKTFTIGKTSQEELVIEDKPASTVYGDTFTLSTSGGSSSSAVTWGVTGTAATVDPATGDVEITGVGEVTITATNPGDKNYQPVSAQWTFTAAPKPVTASVTVASRAYDGTTDAAVSSADITADLVVSGDDVTIDKTSITAAFDTPGVGTGKTVTLDTLNVQVSGADAAKYDISYPDTVNADITQANTTITAAPAKNDPLTYNRQPQELVKAGQTNVGFLVYSLDGTNFSRDIPTGTDAGTYTVYYKVDGTADYTGVAVNTTPISVIIAPKPITPEVKLSESSYLYDGTKKDPKITVKDGNIVLEEDQYGFSWDKDLTSAGTHTVTISAVSGKNYTFSDVTAQVEITPATQAALKITGKPDHVCYGDTVTTLDTTGGSGNGTVTWSITAGGANSSINGGKLIVKDTGSITVTAERAVANYGTVSDTWTFDVEPKPVVAEVTITPKVYDRTTGIDDGDITAAVKAADLVDPANDNFTISGLTGVYEDANAGTGKTVTLDGTNATTTADTAKYAVSYPDTVKADITPKNVTVTAALSGDGLQTDANGDYYLYDGAAKTPAVKVTADDGTELASGDYTVSYSGNTNAGTAVVTVKNAAGGNYTFADKTVNFEIRNSAAVLTSTPQAKDLTYNGTAQDLVTVGTAAGGTVVYSLSSIDPDDESTYSETIPQQTAAGTYTVHYMVKGDGNHDDIAPRQVSVTIKPKEITPVITLSQTSYEYDGNECEPTVTVKDGADTVGAGEYTVSYRDNVNAGVATVVVSDNNGGNYTVNGSATFTITKKAPTFTAPTGKTDLQYNGEFQDLVTAGVCSEGTVHYSVNGGNYSAVVPAAMAVGNYTITYKVVGDDNHSDVISTTPLTVEIKKNTVNNPTITLSSDTFRYNGGQQQPTITVRDDNRKLIPENEYTVTITGTNGNNGMVDVDTYTITVTTPNSSNYVINSSNTRTYKIVEAEQETISITGTKAQVFYGDTIQLGTSGGTGSETITWTVTANDGSTVNSKIGTTGLLTVKDVGGPFTVTVKRSAGGNYKDVSATWEFSADKKPVTAVVTADDRPYADGDNSATVHASVPDSELVSGDSITITNVTGTFDDPNVGANKRVTVDSTNAAVTGSNWSNYEISYPAAATASILAEAATVDTEPAAKNLTYDASQAQELVTAGVVTGGTMVYSLDGANYTAAIPRAKDAGTYTVYFKARGDGNHTDSEPKTMDVTIARQTVTPQIELTPPSAKYDGTVKRPEVTLRDGANNVIPTSEYKVTYVSDNSENWTDQGTYTVKIEDISGGNYVVNTATEPFIISTTAQNQLEIVNKPGLVYYGDTFTLSAVGGSGNSPVTWSSDPAGIVEIDNNGFVKIIGVGSATITATKAGDGNYNTATASYPLNALKKPVTAIVTAEDRVYVSGNKNATIHVTWKDGDLVGTDSISTSNLAGTFADDSVGTNKTVTITGGPINSDKYEVKIPDTTTASIFKADATAPALTKHDRVYDGTTQALVSGGGLNTLYSDTRDGIYSAAVPQETNAGTYTVWYKEKGDSNHNDSEPQSLQVTISPKPLTADATNTELSGSDLKTDTDGTYYYEYDGTEKRPTVAIRDGAAMIPASEYTVSYSDNKNVGDVTVAITDNAGGNYTVSGSVEFEIRKSGAQLTSSPQAKDLTYTGQPQELVTVGTATGGHIEYKRDSDPYSQSIPTATDAGTYAVTYKVVGDGNYADSPNTWTVSVTIKPKQVVSPKITVSGVYTYDGTEQKPAGNAVTVEDSGTSIPDTEYTLSYRDNVNAGTATVIVSDNNGGNYTVNGTAAFTIAKADVKASDITAPTGKMNLPYNGAAQDLATAGNASGGTMVYSLEEHDGYSPVIPTGKDVKQYTVWYRVKGDENHNDTDPASVTASIVVNTVANPTVQVTPESVTFNGQPQEPTVTVWDGSTVIDSGEYTVTFNGNMTDPKTYTLTVTGTDTHYTFNKTATFEILPAGQTPLTITGKRERVYYGDTFQLSTEGGNGTVEWKVDNSSIASISDGLLTITGVGSVTVTATSKASGYKDQIATWRFVAEKKPVTAVVTAAAKTYDGGTDATVTATLQDSGLLSGDDVVITLNGSFEDPNVGADKKVNIDRTKTNISGTDADKYDITYPVTATASILKAEISAGDVIEPESAADLKYTGDPQNLVSAGSAAGGIMEYSLDGRTYSASLPTGVNAGDYDVWYRVKGDGNHNDKEGKQLGTVTIARQTVDAPTIEFTPSGASYDGQEHKPSVTVKDAHGSVIPAAEYTVSYGTTDWIKAGDYTVTITGKTDGNYSISGTPAATFTILPAGQSPLTIVGQPGSVQYGDSFTLSAVGGSGTGAVIWEASGATDVISLNNQTGQVEILKSGGPVTITARKSAADGYSETTDSWTFSAKKKPVTPIVTARDKEYDTNNAAQLVITWTAGDLLANDVGTVNLDGLLDGTFDNANVGSNKSVTIQLKTGAVLPADDKYDIKLPVSTTASITPKAASVSGATPTELTYNGGEQALVSGVAATIGDLAYSRDGSYYTLLVPKEKNAGTYTVWYKAQASGNYMDSPAVRVDVTIKPKEITPVITLSQDSYEYDGTSKEPGVVVKDGSTVIPASEYAVSYSSNTAVGTATVTVSNVSGGNYSFTGSKDFTIQAGAAAVKEAPKANNLTYNGFAQELVTEGTAVNGHMVYSETRDGSYSTSIPMKTDAGPYQVWYKVQGDNGAADTTPKSVNVTIQPKEVTPIIRLENRSSYSVPYNGSTQEPDVTVYVESKLYNGLYDVEYSNNINVGTAEVTVQSMGGNYQFLAFKTFTITKGKAEFLSAPTAKQNLAYTGEAQKLVNPGYAKNNGTVLYSLDNSAYSTLIPTAINRDSYAVFAKVQGSDNYEESDVVIIPVEIGVNTVQNPVVTLSSGSFPYTGSEHKPTVTVTDGDDGNVISADEYMVTYSDNVAVGTAKVNIKSKTNGNYSFTASADFQIVAAGQTPLTITGRKDVVYYGDTLNLGTTGGSGGGAVTWSVTGPVDRIADGQYKINSSGSVTITAAKAASSGYEASTDTWSFYANPKPVTAVVTAADKPYDGNDTAILTATVNSGLVGTDVSFTVTAAGRFSDANVGTNKTVVIDGLTVPTDISAKYDIGYPATTTASITQATAKVTSAPAKAGSLTYNGGPQPLLTDGGTAEGGNLAYSVDGGSSYSFDIPTGTDAKSYTVWYKVIAGDENHKDSAPVKLDPVTIAVNTDTPTVLCTPGTFQYDGTEKTPTVVVRDSANHIIPESEYTVTLPSNRVAVGKYDVTVTDNPGGNYDFTASPAKGTFEIVAASQNPLSIITDKPTDLYYGDTFRLTAMGGSGSGAIHWSIDDSGIAEITSFNGNNCVVTVKGTAGFTVEAYREGADGYSDSNTDSVPFVAHPKPVTPVVTAEDKPYDGKTDAKLHAAWKSGDLVGADTIALTVGGEFATAEVGTGKQVQILTHTATGANADKYAITWPDSTTASIYKVDAKLETAPAGQTLTYNGSEQALVTSGSTENNVGTVVYSLSQNGAYSENIPTAKNADKYTVWYKVADSVNYTGVPAASVEVEITKATPTISYPIASTGTEGDSLKDITFSNGGSASVGGKFAWKNDSIKPEVGTSQQDVVFTPDDTANYNTVEFQISVTIQSATGADSTNSGGSTSNTSSVSTASAPMQTTVRNGAANTVLSASEGSRLVRQAAANQSQNVVIKPEVASDVTKSQVSIPASTVSQLKSETDAALTVSAPIADVTIPNTALDTLGSAGGTVSVVTEQVDQGVALTLTAGGEKVEDIPGGVTLSVPAENAGPGTVAVLVRDDGTRETIQKSVAKDGVVNIPLSGSATVEIVDNSKDFSDVPATSWAANAVSFASAHELFNGTSETTFSPDQAMSRGMLTTVLYNLEGRPEQDLTMQDLTSGYSDVSGDAWYADSVAWASEKGIVSGYGNGQFSPDDSVTREQFAVMLWRYAGSPEADGRSLDFTDADQASGYAREALCWAVENGILSGYANGQLAPGETATRAQAAQMLKNFMENT